MIFNNAQANFEILSRTFFFYFVPPVLERAVTVYLFAFRYVKLMPTLEGLKIDPCLPPDWSECSIEKKFRGCTYEITYHNAGGSSLVDRITVDGREHRGEVLPCDEKRVYPVEVYLK